MNRLSKAEIGFNGLASSIASILKEWRPGALKNEGAYSSALASVLRSALPEDTRIEREYRHDGTTCDVAVLYKGILSSDLVLIEVKLNLQKKASYDRLIGQIEGLQPKKNKVALALVGDTDPALLSRVREHARRYDDIGGDKVKVVTVALER